MNIIRAFDTLSFVIPNMMGLSEELGVSVAMVISCKKGISFRRWMTPVLSPPGTSSSMKDTKVTFPPVGLVGPNEASKVHLGTLVGVVDPDPDPDPDPGTVTVSVPVVLLE